MSHQCPREGCTEDVPTEKLACPADWARVPKPLQRAVYRAYRHGEGVGSPEHIAAMDAAIAAMNRG